MLEDNNYVKASISGHETAVKNRVVSFVEANMGVTEEDQRVNLPKLNKYSAQVVDYVLNNLPTGVDRVDGYCIKPILKQVIDEKIAELPQLEITDEV